MGEELTMGWYALGSDGEEYGSLVSVEKLPASGAVMNIVAQHMVHSLNQTFEERGVTFHDLWIGNGKFIPRRDKVGGAGDPNA